MTVRECLGLAIEKLDSAGIYDAKYDARQLFQSAFQLDTASFLMLMGEELSYAFPDEERRGRSLAEFLNYIERRTRRIPLQQILGECEFFGLPFYVNEHVLCPRQDTELLVERIISDFEAVNREKLRVLDLCTGSGCIGISLAKAAGFRKLCLLDISEKALEIAHKNVERNLDESYQVTIIQSDLFSALEAYEPKNKASVSDLNLEKGNASSGLKRNEFDIIVSNPPYIPSKEIEELEPEVREHEPRKALDGAEDGLYFYRKITRTARKFLSSGGRLYVEIGHKQAEDVRKLFEKNGFRDVAVHKDYAGNDRVVQGTLESFKKSLRL